MRFMRKRPVRKFLVGAQKIELTDCGNLVLNPDEQVTFLRPSGAEYDFTAKDWGYYATPSTNGRLVKFGFRAALVKNSITGKKFILVMEKGFEDSFASYLVAESMVVDLWLDE